jgi:hypothetical protein
MKMITDEDVKKLQKTFLTKKDFNTHMKILAKENLKVFATKKDLEKLATKDDLAVQTERTDALVYEVGDLKVEVSEIKDKITSIEVSIDHIVGGVDTLLLENGAGAVILARHTRQIDALGSHVGLILPA